MLLDEMTNEVFAAHVGSCFRVKVGDQYVDLELVEATELSVSPSSLAQRRKPFSLVFQGTNDAKLSQGTYEIEHDKLGTVNIFLVPIQPTDDGPQFEAVFN